MSFFDTKTLTLKNVLLYICVMLGALMLLTLVLRLLPVAIFLFLVLAPPIFVLADAQERGVQRPIAWAVFTLFTWIFGLLVYLLARPEGKGKKFCPHCGGEVDPTFHNCPWCGGNVRQMAGKCPACNHDLQHGWKFCPGCNRILDGSQAADAGVSAEPPPAGQSAST